MKTRSWDSPEGTKIFRTEVVVDNIILVGPRPDSANDVVAAASEEMQPVTSDVEPTEEEIAALSV